MTYKRKSVWENGGDFNDPTLLWYAKAVTALNNRPLNDPISWRFFAAIHGFDQEIWDYFGYYDQTKDILPDQHVSDTYWNQCQHGTWYFLPWHRGYLVAIESILRDEIIKQGGPADWALPYWDYSDLSNSKAAYLPGAFQQEYLPDGQPNDLYVKHRYGTYPLPEHDINLKALGNSTFTKVNNLPGFGGTETIFEHNAGGAGDLENSPHNVIHTDIGGNAPNYGLMSLPDSAGLDPIFYLHHANIDRLWSVWIALGNGRDNPTENHWLNGPLVGGNFTLPTITGGAWSFTPKDVVNTMNITINGVSQGYEYTSGSGALSAVDVGLMRNERAIRLGFQEFKQISIPKHTTSELVGATTKKLTIDGLTKISIPLDLKMKKSLESSFLLLDETLAIENPEPDKVFLKFENIKADSEGILLDIYTDVGDSANPSYVDTLGLFGIKKASSDLEKHGGEGFTMLVDITSYFDRLHLDKKIAETSSFPISVVPRSALPTDANLSIGQISVFRENN